MKKPLIDKIIKKHSKTIRVTSKDGAEEGFIIQVDTSACMRDLIFYIEKEYNIKILENE